MKIIKMADVNMIVSDFNLIMDLINVGELDIKLDVHQATEMVHFYPFVLYVEVRLVEQALGLLGILEQL